MKNLKTTIITALLLLATVSGAVAQEKYHFATLTLPVSGNNAHVVFSNEADKEIALDKKLDAFGRLKVALSEVSVMSDQGWEVINVTQNDFGFWAYHLRKKK